MNTHKHTNITCKLRADVGDIHLKRTALLIYVVFILLLKMQVYIFFSFSYSVTYTRNLNKSGKTALLCCFISSITVVAQYTIYYKNELDLKKRKMRIGFNCPSLAA